MDPLRILIVDDNDGAAVSLAILLRLDGHEVRTAATATAALEEALRDPPRVMLVDIGLPDFDGRELARRIRGAPGLAGIVLIGLSGYGRDADRDRALQAGFDHYFVKPVDDRDLARVFATLA